MENNKKYVVYCYTNLVNHKMYVGQTCQDPKDRAKHDGSGYKESPKF